MRNIYFSTLLILFQIQSFELTAQCPTTVDAGLDVWLCTAPASTQLNASIDGDYTSFSWTPTTGMSGANSLTPTVTVSQTTTYTLKVKAADTNNNLIVNGDFESGNSGFTSDYAYNPGFSGPPFGSYEVTATPAIFVNCSDHTSGSGMYMVIDGADVGGLLVWCQTVPVMPNTDYVFSMWAASLTNGTPFANLRVTINGNQVGGLFPVPGPTCTWRQFTAAWNSGGNGSATICIEDLTVTGSNNDFALDDISLSPICEVSDSVTVHPVTLTAVASPAVSTIPCEGVTVSLSGAGSSSGASITYEWDGPGIVSGQNTLNPVVNAGGIYTLTVTFDNGAGICTKTASVTVIENPNPLNAWIDPPQQLGCGASTATLFGHSSQPGASTYQWTAGPGGNIVSGQGNATATVNKPGTYTLLVTNPTTGCTAETTVTVFADTNPPIAQATASGAISCQQPLVNLSGNGSSTGNTISYGWSTLSGGNIISGQTQQNAVVDGPGIYVLTVSNAANGCTAADTLAVGSTSIPPQISFAAPGMLTCVVDTLALSASIHPPGSSLLWTSSGSATIVSGANSPTPLVTGAGTYFLTATDTLNGCSRTDSIAVVENRTAPQVVLQPADTLTCQRISVALSGNGSSTGGFSYLWMAAGGGNIVSGADSLNPVVDAPGVYTLTITNTGNGCTASSSVSVALVTDPPPVNAGPDAVVTCATPAATLAADSSLTGTGLLFTWQSPDGNITTNPDSSTIQADQVGHYILKVTNPANGCIARDTAVITANQAPPAVSIVVPAPLTCAQSTVTFGLAGGNPGFVYQWQTANGHFVSGQNSAAPVVDQPGQYTLLVTDTTNGCTASMSAGIGQDTAAPLISIAPAATLTCALLQATLQAGANTGNGTLWAWTAANGGNIVSGADSPMPTVDQPGAYTLTATNPQNGCTSTAGIVVQQNLVAPTVDAGPDTTLGCLITTITLQGAGTTAGTPMYAWTASGGGNILIGNNTPAPLIDAPGTYTLVLTDQQNGCSASDTVAVLEDADAPAAGIAPHGLLSCTVTQLTLQGNASSGPNFTLKWSASGGGNILGGDTTTAPIVDQPGIYTLLVTNTQNGCTATVLDTVGQDIAPPQPAVAPPGPLTCATTIQTLSASPAGAGFDFQWQGVNGTILSGGNTATPTVNSAGDYVLTLTRLDNGCTATASATVSIDTLAPAMLLTTPPALTCAVQQAALEAEVLQPAGNFSAAWTTPDGNIASGNNTLAPLVDAPGNYTLIIQNLQNGCTSVSSVSVSQNTTPPLVVTAQAPTLTCTTPQAVLDASASTGQGALGFTWTGPQIEIGANTATPVVSAPGIYTLVITDLQNGCTASGTLAVPEDANGPQAGIAPYSLLTCSVPQLTLPGSASAGPNITLQWSASGGGNILSGDTTATPLVDQPGVYTLLVTNTQNGCTATAQATVSQDIVPPQPVIAPPGLLTCTVQTITLSASPTGAGFNFQWQTTNGAIVSGGNTASPTVNSAGDYVLTLTRLDNGCTATASATVSQDTLAPAITLATPATLTCTLKQVALSGTVLPPTGNFTASWTTPDGHFVSGNNTLAPLVDAPGAYSLTVQDGQNGCSGSASATVFQNTTAPVPAIGQAPVLTCAAPQALLDATASTGQGTLTFTWSGGTIAAGANTATPTVSAATLYALTLTDAANGCTAMASVSVGQDTAAPQVLIAPPALRSCAQPEVTLNAAGSSQGPGIVLSWTTLNGHFTTGQSTLMPAVDAAGQYVLTLLNQQNGCSASASVTVAEDLNPPLAEAGPPGQLYCLQPEIGLQGSSGTAGALSFAWSTTDGHFTSPANTPAPKVDAPGTYLLMVTNPSNGCTATDQVTVTQIPPPGFVPDLVQPDCHQPTGTITFTGLSGGAVPFVFSIDGGQTKRSTPAFSALKPDDYTLVLTDAKGCSASATATILPASFPGITLPGYELIALGDSVLLQPFTDPPASQIADWQWMPETGLSCSDCPAPWAMPQRPTRYTLLITDQNGCTAEARVDIRVDRQRRVFAPNVFSPDGDGVNDVFLLYGKAVVEIRNVQVFSRWGELMFENKNIQPNTESVGWDGSFRGKLAPPGVYVWQAEVLFVDGEAEIFTGDVTIIR